jgi:nitrate/nitrite-specific signal transduction histidine kinase
MPKELQSMTFFLLRRAERRLKHEILSRYPNIANVLNSHLKPDWRNRLDPVVPQIEEPVERHYAIDQFVSQVGRMIVGQFVTS